MTTSLFTQINCADDIQLARQKGQLRRYFELHLKLIKPLITKQLNK